MPSLKLRHAARAIILNEDDRILLCRLTFPDPLVVWVAPGGGVEHGETPLEALRRELREEAGLSVEADPVHVWRQKVVGPGHATGFDGVVNDYFVVRTMSFIPQGAMTDEELAAEYISGWRWWSLAKITDYRGSDLFSPRDLGTPLTALLADGVPDRPVQLGL